MQSVPFYQVDAFAAEPLCGNPAAVMLLPEFPNDGVLRGLAQENNLSETAFVVEGRTLNPAHRADYALRWFTPATEVALCGHATLAAALVHFVRLDDAQNPARPVRFSTRSGVLEVALVPTHDHRPRRRRLRLTGPHQAMESGAVPPAILAAMGAVDIRESFAACDKNAGDIVLVLSNPASVAALSPDFRALSRLAPDGVIATARADSGAEDFVTRYFAPKCGIDEDPVTGYAHFMIAPYWAQELGRDLVTGRQISHRPGTVTCEILRDSGGAVDAIALTGTAVVYAEGLAHFDSRA